MESKRAQAYMHASNHGSGGGEGCLTRESALISIGLEVRDVVLLHCCGHNEAFNGYQSDPRNGRGVTLTHAPVATLLRKEPSPCAAPPGGPFRVVPAPGPSSVPRFRSGLRDPVAHQRGLQRLHRPHARDHLQCDVRRGDQRNAFGRVRQRRSVGLCGLLCCVSGYAHDTRALDCGGQEHQRLTDV